MVCGGGKSESYHKHNWAKLLAGKHYQSQKSVIDTLNFGPEEERDTTEKTFQTAVSIKKLIYD